MIRPSIRFASAVAASVSALSRARPAVRASRVLTAASAASRSYHAKVIDHYTRPRNVGALPKTDADVGSALVGAPACGDVLKLQIRVGKDGVINDVKFKTFGCGSAIASSSYLTELVRGMNIEEAGKIKNTQIAKELCLPPVKLHCSMLAEDAIKSAISDYYVKNPHAKPSDLTISAATPLPTAA